MALWFLYLMTRRLLGMLLRRFQLEVLRRQVQRPQFQPADRGVLAALSSMLPRGRWSVFLVTPTRSCGGTAGWWRANGRSLTVEVAVRRSPTTW